MCKWKLIETHIAGSSFDRTFCFGLWTLSFDASFNIWYRQTLTMNTKCIAVPQNKSTKCSLRCNQKAIRKRSWTFYCQTGRWEPIKKFGGAEPKSCLRGYKPGFEWNLQKAGTYEVLDEFGSIPRWDMVQGEAGSRPIALYVDIWSVLSALLHLIPSPWSGPKFRYVRYHGIEAVCVPPYLS